MQQILIVQTAFLGDVVLMLPIVQRLKQKFPDAQLNILVRKGNEGILENHPDISRVWVWDKQTNKYPHLLGIWRKLVSIRFDLIVNVQRYATTGLLTWLLRGKQKSCFKSNPFAFACTYRLPHRISLPDQADYIHETDRNLSLIGAWAPTDREPPRLYPSSEDHGAVLSYRSRGIYVVIAPGSVWFTKQVPRTKWHELIRQLSARYHIFLVGSKTEAPLCEELAMLHIHAESLAGKLTLLQTAALMQGAKQVFCNDSAPMHIASAVDAPTTAVYCSTLPAFGFGPLAPGSRIIETPVDLSCRPCGLHGKSSCPLKHYDCGYTLDVHDILGEFRK